MSGYTIGEIVIWLLLAAALGFALGWIARELFLRAKPQASTRAVTPVAETEPIEPAEQAPAKKAPAKKAAAKKVPAKKAAAKKVPAKKAAARKAAPPRGSDDT